MCQGTFRALRTIFSAGNISATSFRPFADVLVSQGKQNLLSTSVGFLTTLENYAAMGLSGTIFHLIVLAHVQLFTVLQVCTGVLEASVVASVARL